MYANEVAIMPEPVVEVLGDGGISAQERHRARAQIAAVLGRRRLTGTANVRLTRGYRSDGTTLAQIDLRVAGTPVRCQIDGPAARTIDLAADRLERALDRLLAQAPPRWAPDPARPPLVTLGDVRPIVRRKVCVPHRCDAAAAVATMDALDYDAHLFTDLDTGEDAIVYWAGPLGVRMARQRRLRPPRDFEHLPMTMNPHPTRVLTESAAAVRLCGHGLPFLFFTEPEDGRGRLLYRRYDGDLGLVIATSQRPSPGLP
ncbi:sigma 54 modulation/S30EA ribosomal C-terminal domain-containing protein [Nocardia niigatensis]|uniref:sigma 54 modulation/S30EA ribosomal C-terminal domain-containing protein n=1 Tax=Nocardia niigatensis TaxID=209249 RepID=UPI0003055FA5|nr:sigma 54 modulation/S30EA ribosomal C-terminal domain-containing protein [Nocardia niigatensis]